MVLEQQTARTRYHIVGMFGGEKDWRIISDSPNVRHVQEKGDHERQSGRLGDT